MKDSDLRISCRGGQVDVIVQGRANFEYAVPLREIAKNGCSGCRFELSACVSFDSTFMGVLTMLALQCARSGGKVELFNASDYLKKLLKDLGVSKLFVFSVGDAVVCGDTPQPACSSACDMLETARTVAEAHETLVIADDENSARFGKVIDLAKSDVDRLERERGVKGQ